MGHDPVPIRLQPLTRAKVASLGAAGAAWSDALPGLLAELERSWSLTLGAPLPGGSHSYVVRAHTLDGAAVVVKVGLPVGGFDDQVAVLRRADGRGYVRLLAADAERYGLLLEALGEPLDRSGLPPEDQLGLLADTLRLAWQPPPAGQRAQDKAGGLATLVAELDHRLGRPGPPGVVERALAYAGDLRDPNPADLVVVHGDPHPGNLLRAEAPRPGAETGYCFVDPDGFVADRAYDLGVALRDWSGRLTGPDARALVEGWCRLLADRSGVDYDRIWRWGFLERVSTGLYVMSFGGRGAERLGAQFLAAAGRLV